MGRPIGPKKGHRYSVEFKLTAVKLSDMPGVQVQAVAAALDVQPFMLSRWRKEKHGTGFSRAEPDRASCRAARARALKKPSDSVPNDRGVEYAAYAFRNRLTALGFVQSTNRPREITDNAHMESFFHSMKSAAVHGIRFAHHAGLNRLVRSYIPYYNGVRLHSGIGYPSPIAYEARAT